MKETKEQKIKKLERKLKQVRVLIDTLNQELEAAKYRQDGLLKEMEIINGKKD